MDVWTSTNKPRKQHLLALGSVLVGVVLAIGFRDFPSLASDRAAGFGLGLVLLVIGIAALTTAGTQTIVIDPTSRRITIEDTNRLGSKTRAIAFEDVVDVGIGYLGKASNGIHFYYLALKLRGGETYALFGTWPLLRGTSYRAVVAQWKARLEGYLGVARSRPLETP